MSTYGYVILFSTSLVAGAIALICWLLEVIFKKLHLDVVSEIFEILKFIATLGLISSGGVFILMLSIKGLVFVVTYVADFIFALL